MTKRMTYRPLVRALEAAGVEGLERSYLYPDYLYDWAAGPRDAPPISEIQWEALTLLLEHRKMEPASRVDELVRERERAAPLREMAEQDAENIVDTHLPGIADDFAKKGMVGAAMTIRRARALLIGFMESSRPGGVPTANTGSSPER